MPTINNSNADTDKTKILYENKGKTAIYKWTHIESGNFYIGSSIDLSRRLRTYYSKNFINRVKKNSYIYNALKSLGYSAFSLTILEYINIQDMTKEEARKLILEREQYYIDTLKPKYNINPIAGSSLGYKHLEETLDKMSGEKNHFFGKTHTEDTKSKISQALSGEQ